MVTSGSGLEHVPGVPVTGEIDIVGAGDSVMAGVMADGVFEWLDIAVQYNDSGLRQIPVEILFANIHDDPRWLPFLESIGMSPEQLAAIEFEVTVPD